MVKRRIAISILVVLLCFLIILLAHHYRASQSLIVANGGEFFKIIDCNSVVLDVFELELLDLNGMVFANNGEDYANPWVMAANGIHYSRNGDIDKAKTIAEELMHSFYNYGCFPRDEYQSFRYGWVSCMDAPTVCVLVQMLYEITGEEKYRQYVDDLSPYLLLRSEKGGYILELGRGNLWLLEYCEKETTISTAEYVLNGSLIGCLSTLLVAKARNNTELFKVVENQTKQYKK